MKNSMNEKAIKILNELLCELKTIPQLDKISYKRALQYAVSYISLDIVGDDDCDSSPNVQCASSTISSSTNVTNRPYFSVTAVVGNIVVIKDKIYVIAHIDNDNVYLILKYWEKNIRYGKLEYASSSLKDACESWYNEHVPQELKDRGSMVNVTVNGVTSPCFIPTSGMVSIIDNFSSNNSWSYFNSTERRSFKDIDGCQYEWWTSDVDDTNHVWVVDSDGALYGYIDASRSRGFRPALAIKRSEFLDPTDMPHFDTSAVVGNEVTLMDKKYIVANIEDDIVYLILKYWEKDCYNYSNTYSTHMLKDACESWYNEHVPQELKDRGSMVSVDVNGTPMSCFVPSREMVQHWKYFNSNDGRTFEDINGVVHNWWTSSVNSSSYVWVVGVGGNLNGNYGPNDSYGFRPALAIKKSEFSN